ncbi:MAG: tRNA (adenosine(37)-N6)-threonylcarbamoyltransferase complex dimerization subunit type 1 TsaB [Phycisphaerae bacterium]|jgi:tRNA threonylcarbamoyladenosine biosynthesis protein TsaB|nr:tRNA (adenosine(37)-N6)-threonylcarbamoyltransferase complex dimerization subunit type 1 TsaB [Phycisphaerae bacterium]
MIEPPVSLAIETSCRTGGVALGRGDELIGAIDFDASSRHAVQLVPRLAELLESVSLRPADVDELYVSSGPGSFTGLRVGLTVARTMGQMLSSLRCLAVPTPHAVALRAAELPWDNLAVVLDARDACVYVSTFARCEGQVVPQGRPRLLEVAEFLADVQRPITLTGEGLAYHDLAGEGISIVPQELHFPTAGAVWRAGRQMARDGDGKYTDYSKLTPIYARDPEVLRLEDQSSPRS